MRERKGFTLIELLVVIAIMALLVAILLPALQRARRQTKTVACQANLKQWGVILAAYTDDNGGQFFRGMLDGSWNDWIEILQPFYGKIGGLTCCPLATKTADKGGEGVFAAWKDPEGDYGSYGLSAWVCNADPGAVFGDELYWRRPNVKRAQDVPVFLDCRGITGWPDHSSIPPDNNGQPPQGITLTEQMKNFCIERHGGGMTNCLFMDWSVRKVGLKELWTLKWHSQFDTAGPWTTAGGIKPEDWPEWMRRFKDY
jgi:prepilin-type N-terminal cleavage/methylation domain-containing protein/prepilin-type processing-associated H-X9-DG protein